MTVTIYYPKSREEWLALRRPNIGASIAGALVGEHPFDTAYGLYAKKSGKLPDEDMGDTPALRRGRMLEPVAIAMLREDHPEWEVHHNDMPGGSYFVDQSIRLSATPDSFVTCPTRGRGVCQIKSVESNVFRQKWKQEGVVEPPLYVVIQAIVEAHLTKSDWACVAALVVGWGIDLHVVEVPIHAPLVKMVREKVADFWHMVDNDMEPPVDFGRDLAVLQDIAMASGDGPAIDLSSDNMLGELLDEKAVLTADAKFIKDRQAAIKAELLHKLNGASSARVADGRVITSKTVQRSGYTVEANSFRDIRIRSSKRGA